MLLVSTNNFPTFFALHLMKFVLAVILLLFQPFPTLYFLLVAPVVLWLNKL